MEIIKHCLSQVKERMSSKSNFCASRFSCFSVFNGATISMTQMTFFVWLTNVSLKSQLKEDQMTIQISDEVMVAMLNFVLVLLKKEPVQLPDVR